MKKSVQIEQCRMDVDEEKTAAFYECQSLISENCTCEYCSYFEKEIVKRDVRLFSKLRAMGVILERQPDTVPGGVSCVGDTEKYEKGYLGGYKVFGVFGTPSTDANGELEPVRLEESTELYFCSYNIVKISDAELEFQFWLEIDRKG